MTEVNYHLADLSEAGGCAGRASHTAHLWLTINKCGRRPSQTGKHWRQSTWQAGRTRPLPPHALTVVRKPLSCFPSVCTASLKQTRYSQAKLMHWKIHSFTSLWHHTICFLRMQRSVQLAAESEASTMATYCYVRRRISPALMGWGASP